VRPCTAATSIMPARPAAPPARSRWSGSIADAEAYDPGSADVAAGDTSGEAEHRVIDQDIGRDGGDEPEHQPPMHVGTGMLRSCWPRRSRGSTACEACRVLHRALDQMVEDRKRDIDQQQARDRLVDAAILPKRTGGMIHRPPRVHRRTPSRFAHRRRRPRHASATDVADSAPIRSAPSPPMITMPIAPAAPCTRQSGSTAPRASAYLPGEPGPERTLVHVEIEIERFLPNRATNIPNTASAPTSAAPGSGCIRCWRRTLEEAGIGGRSNSDRRRRIRRVSCHEVAPSTPSTR